MNLHLEGSFIMPSFTSSWGEAITSHLAQAKSCKDNQNRAYAAFTYPGFTYALSPLQGSQKQIMKVNHLMLQQGYCDLRLFMVKYRRQNAAYLGQNPTFSRIEEQLGKHAIFHRSDMFVTAYISRSFQAHIPKFSKENHFHVGTLRRLNSGMPIRVVWQSLLPAPPQS